MRRIEQAAPQKASRALLAHIREKYGSIPAFAEARGLDRIKVQKAVAGKIQRMDVAFALEIEQATNGAVPVPWWNEPRDSSGEHAAVAQPKGEAS